MDKIDIDPGEFSAEIAALIPGLLSTHLKQRSSSRRKIEKMGVAILPEIHKMIWAKNKQLQWEAAKIVQNIASPQSLDALISLLEDPESDIRWIAAEGLINIGRKSIVPLLKAVIEKGESLDLQHSARSVFKRLFTKEEKIRFSDLLRALKNKHKTAIIAPAKASEVMAFFREAEQNVS